MSTVLTVQRKNARMLTLNGLTKSLSEWAREYNINHATILQRINYGWSISDAIQTPVGEVPLSKR